MDLGIDMEDRRAPTRQSPSACRRRIRALFAPAVMLTLVLGTKPRALWAQGEPAASPGDRPPASGETKQGKDAQFVRVGVDQRVTLHLSDLPLGEALRMLSEPTQRNIILTSGVQGTVTASMYDVSFEAALDAMLLSNGLGYRAEGGFLFVYTLEDLAAHQKAARKHGTRVYHLSYLHADAVKGLIEPMLSDAGKIAVSPAAGAGLGGEAGPEDTEGNSVASSDTLIVTDYLDILDQIDTIIEELDVRPKQVLIESTILRATLSEDNALGIDFTTVGGIDFSAVDSVSPAAQDITTGNIPTNLLNDTNFTVRTDLNDSVPTGGFTFGIIKDQIGVFIRALEEITDTDILANPKLLALNKQVGQVIVGRRDGYITTTITETSAIQTVEFLETGTILTFRPYIGNDGYVRMEIHPKDSTGGLTQVNLPFEQTTEVTTNVLVKDGHTILIGGLFREVSTAARGQVPGLGNIPIAGALFRTTTDTTVREEVIVLLTVRIIKGTEDDEATAELREDAERHRVGMRKGMQWFGRERLAQTHYKWALEHLARGDREKALWDAQLALHNYPRHIHAAKLVEKISRERAWESEASSIRTFIRDRILADEGAALPAFGRPGPPFVLPDDSGGGETNESDAGNRTDDPEPPSTHEEPTEGGS